MKKQLIRALLCALLLGGILVGKPSALSAEQVAMDGDYTSSGEVDVDGGSGWSFDWYTFSLTLKVSGGTISSITQQFTQFPDDTYSDECQSKALAGLRAELLGKPATVSAVDSYAVDAVSGATFSYHALRSAVLEALANAPEAANVTRHTVTYDLNGAPDGTLTAEYAAGDLVEPIEPVWKDHVFTGWTGVSLTDGSFLMPEQDVTLTAHWLNTVTIGAGGSKTIVRREGGYALRATLGGAELPPSEDCLCLCALYDGAGRVILVRSAAVTEGKPSYADFVLDEVQTGWRAKVFLLQEDDGLPLVRSAELRFADAFPDGVYSGSAQCLSDYINYLVDVEVTVTDGVITGLTDKTLRTPMSTRDRECYAAAWEDLYGRILSGKYAADGFEAVDAVSGATISSNGINAAVCDAVSEQRVPMEPDDAEVYAPEGISLYARAYPVVKVKDGTITDIRVVPARDSDGEALSAFAAQIREQQSVNLPLPSLIQDDAYSVASLIDQLLYGKGVLNDG
ncbi:MAG: FMN-binding protein [Oscillospiraceae bacterium]|nr:FMN-binding protein [Oscillospiraceae bacterium]